MHALATFRQTESTSINSRLSPISPNVLPTHSSSDYSQEAVPVFISRWMGARLLKLVTDINHYPQN